MCIGGVGWSYLLQTAGTASLKINVGVYRLSRRYIVWHLFPCKTNIYLLKQRNTGNIFGGSSSSRVKRVKNSENQCYHILYICTILRWKFSSNAEKSSVNVFRFSCFPLRTYISLNYNLPASGVEFLMSPWHFCFKTVATHPP